MVPTPDTAAVTDGLARIDAIIAANGPASDVNTIYASIIQKYTAARNSASAADMNDPFFADAERRLQAAVQYARLPGHASSKYSPLWWNQQASGPMGLTRDLIQQLTGMQFSTKWNADGTVDYFWYIDVRNRAPGFSAAGLLLDPGKAPADVTPFYGLPDYPNWNRFVSAQGFLAPGANAPWTPALDGSANQLQGPIAAVPSTPVGIGPPTVPGPEATPPVPFSPTAPITTLTPWDGSGGGVPPGGFNPQNRLDALAPAQPNASAPTRTAPNVWLWLALGVAAVLAFAYFRGRD